MLWWLSALAMDEACNGLDDDHDGDIDEEQICGPDSLTDFVTGNAYLVEGFGSHEGAIAACDQLGYDPVYPTSYSIDLLLTELGTGPFWSGAEVVAGEAVDHEGTPQSYHRFSPLPTVDSCSLLTDDNNDGLMEWQPIPSFDCPFFLYPYLCEARCERISGWEDLDNDGSGEGNARTLCGPLPDGWVGQGGDCDDDDPLRVPGAHEVCDGVDNNCDGQIDEGYPSLAVFVDHDEDGVGTGSAFEACEVVAGTAILDGDCDDQDADRSPLLPELCDGIDNDCNLQVDDAAAVTWYEDTDGDGFGSTQTQLVCAPPGSGWTRFDGDCDDQDPHQHPGADETCSGEDDDCNGLTDDDPVDPLTFYRDHDQDGSGDPHDTVQACALPVGYVLDHGDCAPTDPLVGTNGVEACVDHVDNDCDGLIDSEDPDWDPGMITFWPDQDGDGYGVPSTAAIEGCPADQPPDFVPAGLEDCDDARAEVAPFLIEVCDGLDNDCSNGVDNGLFFNDYWPDHDGDGFGAQGTASTSACLPLPGSVRNQSDCIDDDADFHPDAHELCDGLDNNCNLLIDDGVPTDDYYPDLDGDGFGDQDAVPTASCSPVHGRILDGSDCDDSDGTVNPSAEDDPADGVDTNCDGAPEDPPTPPRIDADGDGVPDGIDPSPNGSIAVEADDPTPQKYGCGCTASTSGWAPLRRR